MSPVLDFFLSHQISLLLPCHFSPAPKLLWHSLTRSSEHLRSSRDYYDLAYFLSRNTPINLKYLEAKLQESGHYKDASGLTRDGLIDILSGKFQTVDFEKAKQDVAPFLNEQGLRATSEWSAELFTALVKTLHAEKNP